MFFYPDNTDGHEKRKQAGLCEGVIEFMRCFVTEQDEYSENPIETVNTTLFTLWIKEVEKRFVFMSCFISWKSISR